MSAVPETMPGGMVHEAPRACGYGAELAAQISERAIEHLQAPIVRVTGADTPFPYDLLEGAKGVQLAEKGIESWQKRCWVDVPALTAD